MKKYIALKNNLQRIYLSTRQLLKSHIIEKEQIKVKLDFYRGFITVDVEEIVTLFYFFNSSNEKPFVDFIEVTNNPKYCLKALINGSVIKTNVIIEGADGVGKSTIVNELAEQGYLTQDRAIKEITQKMREEVTKKERVESIRKYLEIDKTKKVIFLYLSDEKELKNRINSRKIISEYDKKALILQRLYLETYYFLKSKTDLNNLILINCLGKTPKDIAKEVEELITT